MLNAHLLMSRDHEYPDETSSPLNAMTHQPLGGLDEMEIRKLRHFVAVADTLNFRIAGERLHLTQPALTRSIAGFEQELGVRLFHRDRQGVKLSADGAQLLKRARELLAAADEFSYAAHSLNAASERLLRLGLYGNGLAELTHPVLQAFTEQHPTTTLQVRDADFSRGIEPLLSGEYDIAFLRAPVDLPELKIIRLFAEPMDLVVWKGHRLERFESADVSEIFEDPWVTLPPSIPGPWGAFWLLSDPRAGKAPKIGAYARSEGEFAAAVSYRKLSGVLPASVQRLRPHPGVRAVKAAHPTLSPVAVAYRASGFNPAAAALAETAVRIARSHLHLVPHAQLSHDG